jgi:predicted ATP-grasp superfamily ATP-dependent carboligase
MILIVLHRELTYLIDINAMPTNTAFTASLRPAYSIANGSISYNVRKAITPPTVQKGK